MRNVSVRLLNPLIAVLLTIPAGADAQTDLRSYAHAATASYDLYAPTRADLERAQPELDRAASRFADALGVAAPKIAVVLTDGTPVRRIDDSVLGEGVPVLWWMTDAAWAASHGAEAGQTAGYSESHILPHEACHFFLVAYADDIMKKSGRPTTVGDRSHYGHSALPDWMDEGIAMMCENADMRERRRAWLQQAAGEHPALSTLLDMANPLSGPMQTRRPPAAAANGEVLQPGTVVGAMTFSGAEVGADRVTAARFFYAQTHSFTEYVMSSFGRDALRTLIEGTLNGEKVAALLPAVTGGKAATIADLERSWQASLRK